jgi:hypothetical protein
MTPSRRLALDLHLDLGVEPIEGEVSAGREPAEAFSGWLGLAAALERVAKAATEDAAQNGSQPGT